MKNKNLVGLTICVLVLLIGFSLHGNIAMYLNLSGFLVVLGGTCGAALIGYRFERLSVLYKVVVSSYKTKPKEPIEIVSILVDLAVKSKIEGLLSLERDEKQASVLFLREGLGLLVDGFSAEEIRNYLSAEMNFFKLRTDNCEQILRNIANLFHAFGLVGSVVGLIGMMAGVGDTQVILKTVPIALTSTLYGIVFANFFFIPFASNLRERTRKELLLQKIIMEGIIAIESEVNPNILERKLKSFLTPAMRPGKMVSFEKIRKRFNLSAAGMSRKNTRSVEQV